MRNNKIYIEFIEVMFFFMKIYIDLFEIKAKQRYF